MFECSHADLTHRNQTSSGPHLHPEPSLTVTDPKMPLQEMELHKEGSGYLGIALELSAFPSVCSPEPGDTSL